MSSNNFRFKKADLGAFESKNSNLALAKFGVGCRIMGLTRGNFSLIDLIHSVLKKTGVASVVCVTWSAGIKDVHNIKWMLDSDLIRTFTLITDHSYKTRQKKYAVSIEELFGVENIRTSEIHAKFTLISNDKYNVVITTSMNLNANKTCESFEINEDKEIYDFYYAFVEHIVGEQRAGFVQSSKEVNKVLDTFFSKQNSISGWSEI